MKVRQLLSPFIALFIALSLIALLSACYDDGLPDKSNPPPSGAAETDGQTPSGPPDPDTSETPGTTGVPETNGPQESSSMYEGYEGDLDANGLRSGWGTWTYENFRYEGNWKNDMPNGEGTLSVSGEGKQGVLTLASGNWVDGFAEGTILFTMRTIKNNSEKILTWQFQLVKGCALADETVYDINENAPAKLVRGQLVAGVPPWAEHGGAVPEDPPPAKVTLAPGTSPHPDSEYAVSKADVDTKIAAMENNIAERYNTEISIDSVVSNAYNKYRGLVDESIVDPDFVRVLLCLCNSSGKDLSLLSEKTLSSLNSMLVSRKIQALYPDKFIAHGIEALMVYASRLAKEEKLTPEDMDALVYGYFFKGCGVTEAAAEQKRIDFLEMYYPWLSIDAPG
ncbi:MAG: hypothetical protein FWE59_03195 [Oscillospiraceae bacterium]|nr:hypothetical protein [Oscillospiraceae bacterium]